MSYDAKDIQSLEFPVSVQRRAAMYIGEPSRELGMPGQKNVCIREIMDNAVGEAIKGEANHVNVYFKADGTIIIEDNGRGVPVDYDEEAEKTGIEKCFITLHSGGAFENHGGKATASINGVGGSCVCAMSEKMDVLVIRDGNIYEETFENGYVSEPMTVRKLKRNDPENWLKREDFNQ